MTIRRTAVLAMAGALALSAAQRNAPVAETEFDRFAKDFGYAPPRETWRPKHQRVAKPKTTKNKRKQIKASKRKNRRG